MKERILKYEKIFDLLNNTLNNIELNLNLLEDMIPDIKDLDKYYQSKKWLNDFLNIDNKEIKCGILSEDGIWNLLDKFNDIEKRIKDINIIINKTQP